MEKVFSAHKYLSMKTWRKVVLVWVILKKYLWMQARFLASELSLQKGGMPSDRSYLKTLGQNSGIFADVSKAPFPNITNYMLP